MYKVYELKLQSNTKIKAEYLNKLFLEAKWLYNFLLSNLDNQEDKFKYLSNANKIKEVIVRTPNWEDKRELEYLSSQMKQAIWQGIINNLKSLSGRKKNWYKNWKLKFKSKYKSIWLKQAKITYKLNWNKLKLQWFKRVFRVLWVRQIPEWAILKSARLIKKTSWFYLYILYEINNQNNHNSVLPLNRAIWIDFGIKHQLVLSNSIAFDFVTPLTKRIKKQYRIIHRRQKSSKNRYKARLSLQRLFERLSNIKREIKNKILHYLKQYKYIIIQDENIKAWQKRWGWRILSTAIGGIISSLKNSLETLIVVDKFYPSTQICSNCWSKYKLNLSDRIYKCSKCWFEIDRDLNSAINIVKEWIKSLAGALKPALPLDWGEVTPVERMTSALMCPHIKVSCLVEAGSPSL